MLFVLAATYPAVAFLLASTIVSVGRLRRVHSSQEPDPSNLSSSARVGIPPPVVEHELGFAVA
eukprot:scaffold193406_cov51-Attheya_sp.AAC.1